MMHQGGTQTTTPASTAIVPLQSKNSVATEKMNVRGLGGNRWSREETLALLKIRSDLVTFFRDNIFTRPLWDEVSRKMAELGYIRDGRKCCDKFHNLYRYYKRIKKKGTTSFRFFDQFKALETLVSTSSQLPLDSSDVEIGGTKELIERYMKQVVDKQEEFFEAFEKREQERIVRHESWRAQEIARINREHEIIAQERSMLAAKDASLVALLQKLSENLPNQPTVQLQQPPQPSPQPLPTGVPQPVVVQPPQSFQPSPPPPPQAVVVQTLDTAKTDNGDQDMTLASASTSAISEFITVSKRGNRSIDG